MPRPNKEARRRRARKKWCLGNVGRLRGTWSEGSRGEGGCLAASGDLGQLFPETLATGALCIALFLTTRLSATILRKLINENIYFYLINDDVTRGCVSAMVEESAGGGKGSLRRGRGAPSFLTLCTLIASPQICCVFLPVCVLSDFHWIVLVISADLRWPLRYSKRPVELHASSRGEFLRFILAT